MTQSAARARVSPPLLAAVLTFVLAAVSGCGLLAGTKNAQQPDAALAPAPLPSSARSADAYFGALAGYGCPQRPQAGFNEAGWYADGVNGFVKVRRGGWDHQGCDGDFDAMPMSGSATRPDPENYAVWSFRTAPVSAGICQTAVYVPDDASVEHVGGNPAQYQVYDSAAASGVPAGSFGIDELSSRGQWVSGGSYPLTHGVLTIKLVSAGLDWHGNVVTHAHLPVSQVLVFCHQ